MQATKEQKTIKIHRPSIKTKINELRRHPATNALFPMIFSLFLLVTLEWVARGTLANNWQRTGFFQSLGHSFPSFLVTYLLLLFVYVFIWQLSDRHWLATALVGIGGYLPAVVTYYKMQMRSEPFLPWDLSQIGDLMNIKDNVQFTIPLPIIITALLFILFIAAAGFIKPSKKASKKNERQLRLALSGTSLVLASLLVIFVFLSPTGSAFIGIRQDAWMQDRYYRTNGVIAGFLTNLQMLNIKEPANYSEANLDAIVAETQNGNGDNTPYYANSPALGKDLPEQPDIIFLMAESFWDVTALDGIKYEREVMPNLEKLSREGAHGTVYTPSFGGGTCDVEFEALTGFSMEFLPAGSKPFQQYLKEDTFSLPQHLKSEGYDTMAVHGFGARFWNRDMAYPRLGIDTFIAEEDFINPERRRGFISDNAMVDKMIEQLDARGENADPLFLHAVTMQNHSTYDRDNYADWNLVKITDYPKSIPYNTIGQLEDCATGVHQMDAALGKLVNYLEQSERPTILVFWGDHLNTMSDGYTIFEETGYIEREDTASPNLYKTPLLMWSNYADESVDLGIIGSYQISPVMMDLYGLEKPMQFDYLAQQLGTMRARSHGLVVNEDGTIKEELTPAQQTSFENQELLQYDYLFGERYVQKKFSKS